MVDGASAMTLFPYLLNVMGSGGWCQYYDIVSYLLNVMGSGGWSIPADCDG